MRPRILLCALAPLLITTVAAAQEPPPVPTPPAQEAKAQAPFRPGIKLYIDKMEGNLDGFLRAEIMKKKVPVTVVLDEASADFIMTGSGSDRKGSWHEGWLSPDRDKATGSVAVIGKTTQELVWAEEAGDRSLWLGAFARGGPRKVASRIADRLKDRLQKGK